MPLPGGRVSATTSGSVASIASRSALGAAQVVAAHRRLEVGELPLHRRDEARDSSRAPASRSARTRCRRRTPCRPRRRSGRCAPQLSDCSSSASTVRAATRARACRSHLRQSPCVAVLHRQRADVRDDALHLRRRQVARRRHRRAGHAVAHHRRELRVAVLHLPRDGADLGRQLASASAQARRRPRRSRRDTTRSAACRVLRPPAAARACVRSEFTYATTFQRCSGVSVPAKPAIGVPATPTEMMRYIIAGVTPFICAAVPIAGGVGCSAAPAGPSPSPRAPWQLAQLFSIDRASLGEVERPDGKLELGFVAEERGEPCLERVERGGRTLARRRPARWSRAAHGPVRRSRPRAAPPRALASSEEVVRLLVFLGADQLAAAVDRLPVLLDGDADDVGHAPRGSAPGPQPALRRDRPQAGASCRAWFGFSLPRKVIGIAATGEMDVQPQSRSATTIAPAVIAVCVSERCTRLTSSSLARSAARPWSRSAGARPARETTSSSRQPMPRARSLPASALNAASLAAARAAS